MGVGRRVLLSPVVRVLLPSSRADVLRRRRTSV